MVFLSVPNRWTIHLIFNKEINSNLYFLSIPIKDYNNQMTYISCTL